MLPTGHHPATGGGQQVACVPAGQGVGCLQPVIEEVLFRAEDLVILVALAGDEHGILRSGEAAGRNNRLPPVAEDRVAVQRRIGCQQCRHFAELSAGGGRPFGDRSNDRLRVLGARVVRGDDGHVSPAGGDGAHERPLAPVAVTAAAEHADEPAGGERAQAQEHVFQRIRGVGVIDEHRRSGSPCPIGQGHPLQAPGYASHPGESGADLLDRQAEAKAGGGRGEDIEHVVAAGERRGEGTPLVAKVQHATEPGHCLHQVADMHLGRRGETAADDAPAVQGGGEPLAPGRRTLRGLADDHRGCLRRQVALEEELFGREVPLHGLVVIQVVTAQVGEQGHIEAETTQPVLLQGVRRHLHDHVGRTAIHHGAQQPLQGYRIRGGEGCLTEDMQPVRAMVAVVDRTDHPGPIAGMQEQRLDQPTGGGLAVGAGDADQSQVPGRVAVPGRGGLGQGGVGVGDHQHRDRQVADVGVLLDHHGEAAATDRLGQEGASVRLLAADGDKKAAGDHPARISGDRRDLPVQCDRRDPGPCPGAKGVDYPIQGDHARSALIGHPG